MSGNEASKSNVLRTPARNVLLDDVDRAILKALSADARMTNSALSERVGVAPSTALWRVRRLQDAGVILGFRAEIAPEALGRELQAIVSVKLQADARRLIGTFAQRVASTPGVLNVFFLAGVNDFSIQFAAHSAQDLRDFVTGLSESSEVASTETNLVFDHITGVGAAL